MHALVQHSDNADIAVGERPPVDQVMLIAAHKPLDTKLGWHGSPWDLTIGNGFKPRKEAEDIAFGLSLTPLLECVAIDVFKPHQRRSLDTIAAHRAEVCLATRRNDSAVVRTKLSSLWLKACCSSAVRRAKRSSSR